MTGTCAAPLGPHEVLNNFRGPELLAMPLDPLDWLPGSPFLRPDWRWRRGRWLCGPGRRHDRRIDDAWVGRARRFLAHSGLGRADRAIEMAAALARTASPARD